MYWAVKILEISADAKTVRAFPYWIDSFPPYPGFALLEAWLMIHYPTAITVRQLVNNESSLHITFETGEDAFMFVLAAAQPKTVNSM
jgi:hypothetical protein